MSKMLCGSGEFVYVMRAGPFFKIGFTRDPEKRHKTIGRHGPLEVTLVFAFEVESALEVEAALHWKYKDLRHRGEWFLLSDEDVENIRETLGSASAAEFTGPASAAERRSMLADAKIWLSGALSHGVAIPVPELKELSDAEGISWRTAERAKKAIGAVSRPVVVGGKTSHWAWSLAAEKLCRQQ